jgi:sulfide:quinone oxidoreductase
MQITQLDALTYVGPQISAATMADLRHLKIGTIIVARPEGETDDQPSISDIREAADAFGITVHQIPALPGNITDDDVLAYCAITSGTDHPVFTYCRSGMRATSLWALRAAQQGAAPDEILRTAKDANFDLTALASRLAQDTA